MERVDRGRLRSGAPAEQQGKQFGCADIAVKVEVGQTASLVAGTPS